MVCNESCILRGSNITVDWGLSNMRAAGYTYIIHYRPIIATLNALTDQIPALGDHPRGRLDSRNEAVIKN